MEGGGEEVGLLVAWCFADILSCVSKSIEKLYHSTGIGDVIGRLSG